MPPTPPPPVEVPKTKPTHEVYQVRLQEGKDSSFMKTAKPLIEGVKGKILHVYADIYGFVFRIPSNTPNPLDSTKAPWNDYWIDHMGTVSDEEMAHGEGRI